MAAADAHNNNKKKTSRRRKKRRTEDFSSSSESSSSSEASDNEEPPVENISKSEINIDEIDIDSEDESSKLANDNKPNDLTNEQKQQLKKNEFTTTTISKITNDNQIKNINNINEISNQLDGRKNQLNNEFLKLMTSEFNEDLDELRKKPDFNNKSSLVLLAKTLQSGSNMFDMDVLSGLIDSESTA